MKDNDLNLLPALNILLEERNVARAAKRMNLSQSAMSRTLARLRATMNDPLLVRAGRGLVPSPRALEIQARVSRLTLDAEAILKPATPLDIAGIERTFTLVASDGFMESIGGELVKRVAAQAPGIRIRFLPRAASQGNGLRDGSVDIETGKLKATTHPELLVRRLFDDRFIGVVSKDHPLSNTKVTLSKYLDGRHIGVFRDNQNNCHLESMLSKPERLLTIQAVVGSYTGAVALARATGCIATVPARHTASFCQEMHRFPLPFDVPAITVSMFWHPRMNADQAHRWLREKIIEISAEL
ncbi:LysR family transcriptional regulator [Photobacterium atrarenae]|uniref:LysR family transcriptional regulator n=1 Tax=Photobacterium atrarenae TaxID=865757 RepID=A0ABY5GBS9_9GAMM|nr:LysR family transcriptional regulator [Photobacterium atrarenae]UTV26646.1 LysR family transcriptional regulator [Photobacterium atrarenae]